jgi:hypothetical protein
MILSAATFGLSGLLAFVIFSRKGTRYASVAIWVPVVFVLGGCLAAFIYTTAVGACRRSGPAVALTRDRLCVGGHLQRCLPPNEHLGPVPLGFDA